MYKNGTFCPKYFEDKKSMWVSICFRNFNKARREGRNYDMLFWLNCALEIKKDLNPPYEVQRKLWKESQKNLEK